MTSLEINKIPHFAEGQKAPSVLHLEQPPSFWSGRILQWQQQGELPLFRIPLQGPWLEPGVWTDFFEKAPTWIRPKLQLQVELRGESRPQGLEPRKLNQISREIEKATGLRRFQVIWPPEVLPAPARIQVLMEHRTQEKSIPLSVILPFRDQIGILLRVLKNLEQQDLSRSDFEIILVDDGSRPENRQRLQEELQTIPSDLQILLLRRESQNELWEGLPRHTAGQARHQGVGFSRGENLLFLDADILLASSHLRELLPLTEQADLIQSPRSHILSPWSQDVFTVEPPPAKEGQEIEDESYWGPFFETKNWASLPFAWRYVCTYCLCLRRSMYEEIGGFKPQFANYGFEDTDLGYEAFHRGAVFYLNPQWVWHLNSEDHEQRYAEGSTLRRRALRQSARVFYASHLDSDIYGLFAYLM